MMHGNINGNILDNSAISLYYDEIHSFLGDKIPFSLNSSPHQYSTSSIQYEDDDDTGFALCKVN